ncbi:hypothetical protein ZWY2020_022143 [Hordeum vulgare]|nr:hypothetical protein ZWY2020_022143 [Hordeum vulgare]
MAIGGVSFSDESGLNALTDWRGVFSGSASKGVGLRGQAGVVAEGNAPQLSKSAKKKLLKQERQAARKAERKAGEKERRRADIERRRREWEESLAAAPSQEAREAMLAARRETRLERVGKRVEERGARAERLRRAADGAGQKVVLDLEFADLMRPNEIHSLTQQIMYCYAVNGRSATPAHLWLTGCSGEMGTQDWKAFFHVIPPRKRGEAGAANDDDAPEGAANEDLDECLEEEANDDDGGDGDEEADVANKRHCIRSENGKS